LLHHLVTQEGQTVSYRTLPAMLMAVSLYAQALWNQGTTCGGTPPDLASSNGLALTVQ